MQLIITPLLQKYINLTTAADANIANRNDSTAAAKHDTHTSSVYHSTILKTNVSWTLAEHIHSRATPQVSGVPQTSSAMFNTTELTNHIPSSYSILVPANRFGREQSRASILITGKCSGMSTKLRWNTTVISICTI